MILVILDDLLFTSKIRTTAAGIGVPVAFAKSADAAIAEMEKSRPDLVIFDLNNPRIDALGMVSRMKADSQLGSIPLLAFASHVQVAAMEAARRAGVGQVLPRSAFAEQLADILRAVGSSR